MTQLRHLIPRADEKALWARKDTLQVLNRDPLRLHKEAFIRYLDAKGKELYEEASSEEDRKAADTYLTELTAAWKVEAKAHNERRQGGVPQHA